MESNMILMKDPMPSENSFNETEKILIKNIKDIIHNFKLLGTNIIVRFSGGWVRDKLLGFESDDIDVTVEGIDHTDFAKKLTDFYPSSSLVVFRGSEKNKQKEIKRLTVSHIQLSSKIQLDICNIQSDPNENSTILPAEYDAKQRDLTINSLFYNINTFEIEDYIDGISDLKNKIIRTPSSIDTIFSKDPHCFLRAFRLASRFGFSIQQEILHPSQFLLQKFKENIKPLQIVKELTKTIKTSDIIQVIQWISEAKLFKLIFDPQDKNHIVFNKKKAEISLKRFEEITSKDFFKHLIPKKSIEYDFCSHIDTFEKYSNVKMIVVLSSIYYQTNKNIFIPKTLIFPHEIINGVKKVTKYANEIESMKFKELTIYMVGIWLRSIGPEWILVRSVLSDESLDFFDKIFVPFVFENQIENIYNIKPLLNICELGKLHEIDISTKESKELIINMQIHLIKWQIENPLGTIDEYINTLMKDKEDIQNESFFDYRL